MKKLICFLALCAALTLPANAAAPENSFILSAEANGQMIIAPEYVSYTEGQTVGEALKASGHTFTGLELGWIYEIDGIAGEFTRSDETGNFSLDNAASAVKFFRFSEETESAAEGWLQPLMTAMADYLTEDADVRAAAKSEYDLALHSFPGVTESDARTLVADLNDAVNTYKASLSGTLHTVSFSGVDGAEICAVNGYGKVYAAENGSVKLPAGRYSFIATRGSDRCEGEIDVSAPLAVAISFPETDILKFGEARFSGSYGAPGTEDSQFTDDEFAVRELTARRCTVPVSDIFTGTLYSYFNYSTETVPTLTAIYNDTEKTLPLRSYVSGIVGALKKKAARATRSSTGPLSWAQTAIPIYRTIPWSMNAPPPSPESP